MVEEEMRGSFFRFQVLEFEVSIFLIQGRDLGLLFLYF